MNGIVYPAQISLPLSLMCMAATPMYIALVGQSRVDGDSQETNSTLRKNQVVIFMAHNFYLSALAAVYTAFPPNA